MTDHSDSMSPSLAVASPPGPSRKGDTRAEGESASGVRAMPAPPFERVYEDHFEFVWRCARRLGVGDAFVDDVVQDVFVVVHRKLPEFEGRSSLKTWLYAIARRTVSDHRRRACQRRPHTPISESMTAPGANAEERAARMEAAGLLHQFLDSLPDEQREVFVLAELEQMTAPEIERAVGAKLNTVYSRLRLARKAFERVVQRERAKRGSET